MGNTLEGTTRYLAVPAVVDVESNLQKATDTAAAAASPPTPPQAAVLVRHTIQLILTVPLRQVAIVDGDGRALAALSQALERDIAAAVGSAVDQVSVANILPLGMASEQGGRGSATEPRHGDSLSDPQLTSLDATVLAERDSPARRFVMGITNKALPLPAFPAVCALLGSPVRAVRSELVGEEVLVGSPELADRSSPNDLAEDHRSACTTADLASTPRAAEDCSSSADAVAFTGETCNGKTTAQAETSIAFSISDDEDHNFGPFCYNVARSRQPYSDLPVSRTAAALVSPDQAPLGTPTDNASIISLNQSFSEPEPEPFVPPSPSADPHFTDAESDGASDIKEVPSIAQYEPAAKWYDVENELEGQSQRRRRSAAGSSGERVVNDDDDDDDDDEDEEGDAADDEQILVTLGFSDEDSAGGHSQDSPSILFPQLWGGDRQARGDENGAAAAAAVAEAAATAVAATTTPRGWCGANLKAGAMMPNERMNDDENDNGNREKENQEMMGASMVSLRFTDTDTSGGADTTCNTTRCSDASSILLSPLQQPHSAVKSVHAARGGRIIGGQRAVAAAAGAVLSARKSAAARRGARASPFDRSYYGPVKARSSIIGAAQLERLRHRGHSLRVLQQGTGGGSAGPSNSSNIQPATAAMMSNGNGGGSSSIGGKQAEARLPLTPIFV